MRIVALVVAALVVLVAVVVVVGALLPRAHQVTRSTELQQSPEQVWAAITDIDGYPDWRSGLKGVERLPDVAGRTRWREQEGHGAITYEIVQSQPPLLLVTRIADDSLPFGGSWTYEITTTGAGARLTVTEDGDVKNPVYRFVSRFVFGHTATLDRYLKALADRFNESSAVR